MCCNGIIIIIFASLAIITISRNMRKCIIKKDQFCHTKSGIRCGALGAPLSKLSKERDGE